MKKRLILLFFACFIFFIISIFTINLFPDALYWLEPYNIFAEVEGPQSEISQLSNNDQIQRLIYQSTVEETILTYEVEWSTITERGRPAYQVRHQCIMPPENTYTEIVLRGMDLYPLKMIWWEGEIQYTGITRNNDLYMDIYQQQEIVSTIDIQEERYFLFTADTILRFFPLDFDFIEVNFWIEPGYKKKMNIINAGEDNISNLIDTSLIQRLNLENDSKAVRLTIQSENVGSDYLRPNINLWYLKVFPHYLLKIQGGGNAAILTDIQNQ